MLHDFIFPFKYEGKGLVLYLNLTPMHFSFCIGKYSFGLEALNEMVGS